jgi:hypothetical protein
MGKHAFAFQNKRVQQCGLVSVPIFNKPKVIPGFAVNNHRTCTMLALSTSELFIEGVAQRSPLLTLLPPLLCLVLFVFGEGGDRRFVGVC